MYAFRNKQFKALILVSIMFWITTSAWSDSSSSMQNKPGQESTANPCTQDVLKFCGSVQKGEGRVHACLKTHQNELSKSCSELLLAQDQFFTFSNSVMDKVRPFCESDIKKYCSGVNPGGLFVWECLGKNIEKLSDTCASKFIKIYGVQPSPNKVSQETNAQAN